MHIITRLLISYTTIPSNDNAPAVLRILIHAPKDNDKLSLSLDEKASYSKALRLAARALLDHHRTHFLSALFTTPSIRAGSLEWFFTTFPNLEEELKEGLLKLEQGVEAVVGGCKRGAERLREVERELGVLPGAAEGVKVARDWVELRMRDLERGKEVWRGNVVGACRIARYVVMTHGVVFGEEDDVVAVTEVGPKQEVEVPAVVSAKRDVEKTGLEKGGEPPEKKRVVEMGKSVSAPARKERGTPTPLPGMGFYKGRNFDPNYRSRGRGYRGGGKGYWGQSPYRGRGGRPGEGYYY